MLRLGAVLEEPCGRCPTFDAGVGACHAPLKFSLLFRAAAEVRRCSTTGPRRAPCSCATWLRCRICRLLHVSPRRRAPPHPSTRLCPGRLARRLCAHPALGPAAAACRTAGSCAFPVDLRHSWPNIQSVLSAVSGYSERRACRLADLQGALWAGLVAMS